MTATLTTQIEIDSQGVAWLAGTQVKVVEIVLDKLARGWSPEEIHFQHPHLSMAQIHVALTYYYEKQELLDGQIDQRMNVAGSIASKASAPDFRRKLVALKSSI